jgi:hypothetical protein
MSFFFVYGEVGFEPFGKFTASQHYAPSATFTFKTDICAKTCDGPFIGTAWMLFAEAQVVVELEVGKHICIRNHYK